MKKIINQKILDIKEITIKTNIFTSKKMYKMPISDKNKNIPSFSSYHIFNNNRYSYLDYSLVKKGSTYKGILIFHEGLKGFDEYLNDSNYTIEKEGIISQAGVATIDIVSDKKQVIDLDYQTEKNLLKISKNNYVFYYNNLGPYLIDESTYIGYINCEIFNIKEKSTGINVCTKISFFFDEAKYKEVMKNTVEVLNSLEVKQ